MEIKEVTSSALPLMSEKDIERFWTKVDKKTENDCWIWTGSKRRRGYGQFFITTIVGVKGKGYVSTRLSYFLANNVDPIKSAVLHKCDNPECVNPDHLFLGSSKQNTDDMMNKGRGVQPKGSHHGQSILTEANICEIRKRFSEGVRQCQLVKHYNVHQSVISRIVNNKRWTHI